MSRSDKIYIQDISESITIIISYIGDKSEHDFINDLMLQDAVTRRFEIIGEAASKISQQFKDQHPNLPWSLMKGMRNKLIHEYFGVSATTLYSTIQIDIPILSAQLKEIF
ncbi:MAG: DUF86 domain-containing protein [Mucilaginibacter sp.]